MTTANHTPIAATPDVPANAATFNGPLGQLDAAIGAAVSTLTTAAKTAVGALNELDADVGVPALLTTTVKSSLVGAVNELDADVGAPASLTTTAKGSLVLAVNELDTQLDVGHNADGTHKSGAVTALNVFPGDVVLPVLTGSKMGFFGHAPAAQPTWITDPAATLASLQSQLIAVMDALRSVGLLRGSYLLRDLFTDTLVAGAIHGTAATPGPGTRVVVDTEDHLSMFNGALYLEPRAAPTAGDPGFWLTPAVTRTAGRLLYWAVTPADTSHEFRVGFATATTGAANNALVFLSTALRLAAYAGGSYAQLEAYTAARHEIVIALRAAGLHIFDRQAGSWLLLYTCQNGTDAELYPALTNYSQTLTAEMPTVRDDDGLWLPTPLASDGFGTAGTTDGLGHPEGVAGGLGAGGNGEVWTSRIGTFGVAGGKGAFTALGGGIGVATIDLDTPDVWVSANLYPSADNTGLVLRYVDTNNYIYVYVYNDGAWKCTIRKVVGGTDSQVQAPVTVATFASGGLVTVYAKYQKFRVFINGALVVGLNEASIIDAALLTATKYGLYSTNTANQFDNFVVWPRGSATPGEYASLDTIFPNLAEGLAVVGDSKSRSDTNDWIRLLPQYILASSAELWEARPVYGVSGEGVAGIFDYVDANLAAAPYAATIVLLNAGSNDAAPGTIEATFKTEYQNIIDAYHTKWPTALIYCAKPWKRGYGAYCDTMSTWIDDLIAANPGVCFAGHDERVWMEGGDDGATMTYDGTHYSDAGQLECASQWQAVLGY